MSKERNEVDLVHQGQGSGEVATHMLSTGRLDPGSMRPYTGKDGKSYITSYTGGDPKKSESYRTIQVNNATLRRDEWKQLDDAIVPIAEHRLVGVQDLISRGLTYNLGNAMGTTVLEWEDVSDAMEATMSMDGVTRGQGDRPVFGTKYLPIPIIHVDYEINTRVLESSRSRGNPLDTTSAERAARKVSDYLEKMLFTDVDYTFGGGTIKSYVNYGDREQVTLDDEWNGSGVTGATILEDVLEMKQASIDNYHYGPWVLYIPTNYETKMDEDYDNTRGNTIRERILAIGGIDAVKVIDVLPDDNVLLVQMTPDVVRLVRGMGLQNVEWQTEGRFITKYKVMTIQVPQLRSDHNGKCGIVHATFSS